MNRREIVVLALLTTQSAFGAELLKLPVSWEQNLKSRALLPMSRN